MKRCSRCGGCCRRARCRTVPCRPHREAGRRRLGGRRMPFLQTVLGGRMSSPHINEVESYRHSDLVRSAYMGSGRRIGSRSGAGSGRATESEWHRRTHPLPAPRASRSAVEASPQGHLGGRAEKVEEQGFGAGQRGSGGCCPAVADLVVSLLGVMVRRLSVVALCGGGDRFGYRWPLTRYVLNRGCLSQ